MSIELSSAPLNPKATTGAEGASGKSKVKAGDKADAPEDGGFAAVLTSVSPPSDPADSATTPSVADDKSPTDPAPVADASALLAPSLPSDLAMLLAQASEVASGKLSLPSEVRTGDLIDAGRLAGATLSNLATLMPPATLTAPAMTATPAPTTLVIGADPSGAANLIASASDKAEGATQSINALLAQIEQTLPEPMHKSKGLGLQTGAAASLAESRVRQQASLTDVASREPTLSGALLNSGLGDGFLRQVERSTSKSSFSTTGSGIEGVWGQSALQNNNRMDPSPVMADPSIPSLETTVADKVSYWVTQGIQNAQLKLDGFGDKPVEVNISLKGDEAQISFRTDQPEVRQILEGAVAHLKELLSSEGLVLSGVSVGTSGQNGAGAQEQGNQPGANKTTFITVDSAPRENLPRVNQSAGRALDLYV